MVQNSSWTLCEDFAREELIALVIAQREIIARLEERIREPEAQD